MNRWKPFLIACAVAVALLPLAARADGVLDLVPGTAVLLDQSSGGGGNGGNTSSTTSSTNIFTPATYVDYKFNGGEPFVAVDRFSGGGDTTYASGPLGVGYPGYSTFFSSNDLGATFHLPEHDPVFGKAAATGDGGGDSDIAIGQKSHRVFFVDLPGPCETVNVSDDRGETFTSDPLGCSANPGSIDDRPWIAADEYYPGMMKVYDSFINFTSIASPTLAVVVDNKDGNDGFVDGDCTDADIVASPPPSDSTSTTCPDPNDKLLQSAGPTVVDIYNSHNIYIPFLRGEPILPGLTAGPPYSLWVAISTDGGEHWTRQEVAFLGNHNGGNIFPVMTVDRAGNLYYTWSQSQGPLVDVQGGTGFFGEQDVYYAYSTNQGATWSQPIDLTQETGDSAVFPWMVAGDAGQVDLVYYKANTGINSNAAFLDNKGNPCETDAVQPPECTNQTNPNPSVWNVYFAQSNNALNTGANFKSVQISDHPNHIGQICTAGLACSTGGNRDLADFFSVDVDHLGAANVIWADDNDSNHQTRNKFSRQVAGNSVFKSTSITLQSSWPIQNHSVTDPAGDVLTADGTPATSCTGMDVLGASESRSGDLLTVHLTLDAPPTAGGAVTCSGAQATGGLWGAEFWASSLATGSCGPNDNFYIAYRSNLISGSGVEAGCMNSVNPTLTSAEFHMAETGTGGTCVPVASPPASAPQECTISMTASLSGLGIKSGAGLYSISGLTAYQFATEQQAPGTDASIGFSDQADVAAPFDDNGTGTTT